MTTIERAAKVDDELVEAMARLVPQLSRSSPPPGPSELERLIAAHGTYLFVARDAGGAIVGTLTLVTFRIPTGLRAWIEDVIVDGSARGQGIGEALTAAAVETAREMGCKTVDLTSRPEREAANRLYLRVGFVARDTNVYRYDIGG